MELLANTDTLTRGNMLNWYQIEGVLGRGGFGVTYLALDTNLDHQVAIKEYLPDQIARRDPNNSVRPLSEYEQPVFRWGMDRFITEARTLVKFKHENIVRVMSVFECNDTAYMVMEFERGQDFKHYVENAGNTSEAVLKNIFTPITHGLAEVHRHGFIHRDIKPANIYIREKQSPVLLDFGSARQAMGNHTQQLTSMVSIGYAPLEQYSDSSDARQGPWTDIYALGATLYFAITGQPPIDSTLRASSVLNDKPDPQIPAATFTAHGYSRDFLQAIDWALAVKVVDRPQSLEEWRVGLLADDRTKIMPMRAVTQQLEGNPVTSNLVHSEVGLTLNWDLPETAVAIPAVQKEIPQRKQVAPKWLMIAITIALFVGPAGYHYPFDHSGLVTSAQEQLQAQGSELVNNRTFSVHDVLSSEAQQGRQETESPGFFDVAAKEHNAATCQIGPAGWDRVVSSFLQMLKKGQNQLGFNTRLF